MGEAVNIEQLRSIIASTHEHRERTSGVHGLELPRVSDRQHLRPGPLSQIADPVQRCSARE